jgi:CHASE3 domain sensor protein
LSLKNKTNIAFFAALATLAIIGWFSFQRSRATEEMNQAISHSRDVLEASELLRSHVYDAAAARRAYSLWRDRTQVDAFGQAYKSALADFATLRKLTAASTVQQLSLAQMEPLVSTHDTHSLLRTAINSRSFRNLSRGPT